MWRLLRAHGILLLVLGALVGNVIVFRFQYISVANGDMPLLYKVDRWTQRAEIVLPGFPTQAEARGSFLAQNED